jgi:hypothetical protein
LGSQSQQEDSIIALTFQTDFMTELSYLLGERTVPSTGTDGRKAFIQDSLNDIYKMWPWRFAEAIATLTVASGLASLPSDLTLNHDLYVKYFGSDGVTATDLELVDAGDQESVNTGDSKYWITSYGNDGNYLLNTKEVISSVVVKYQRKAPTLAASVGTPWGDKMAIALGARRYYRISQDPEADISQDEALFQKRVEESISAQQMASPRKRRKSAQSISGFSTGDI